MVGGKRSPTKSKAVLLRKRCLELRVQGLPYRAIADQMCEEGSKITHTTVANYTAAALEEVNKLSEREAQYYTSLEMQRLDFAQSAAMVAMMKGDVNAINAFVRVSESRRKLLGLDAPIQLQVDEIVQEKEAQFINLLESALEPEVFGQVASAAAAIAEASTAATTN